MKLFKIYQNINTGYDTFDSAVVVANSAEEAQKIHPNGASGDFSMYDSWVSRPDPPSRRILEKTGGLPGGRWPARPTAGAPPDAWQESVPGIGCA